MKKKRLSIIWILFILLCFKVAGQVPNGINYQAILRDNSNNEIANQPIDVKFALIVDSPTGTLIWEEQHSTVSNDIGLFNLLIGDELATKTGGTHADYTDITWGPDAIYLKVSVHYESTWHVFDPSLLNSTPFALISKTAEDDSDKLPDNELIETIVLDGTDLKITEAGDTKTTDLSSLKDSPFTVDSDTVALTNKSLSIGSPNPGRSNVKIINQDNLSEDALFEVKRSDGQTVFAVYNEGVRIFLPTDPLTKGPKGGFAIGGFDPTKEDYTEDYLRVTPDSIRMYFDKTPDGKGPKGGFAIGSFDRTKATIDEMMIINADSTRFYLKDPAQKGPKGGFAIGSFDRTKGSRYEYMHVSIDSTRFYITDDTGVKGPKGGFAIGSFDPTKGPVRDYFRVELDSTRIYVNDSIAGFSVANIQTGVPKKFMDLNKVNSFVGHESGQKTQPSFSVYEGRYNAFFGYGAGKENTSGYGNIFIGHETGRDCESGSYNVYMGYNSGKSNTDGISNVFVGYESGVSSTTGYNVFIGQGAGKYNVLGGENTYMGSQCGIEDGRYGEYAGYEAGNGNTFIGYRTGANHWTGDQNVYIGNRAGEQTQATGKGGDGRIFIGYKAGRLEGADNVLYIENSDSSTPLIFGNFSSGSREVIINGDFSSTGKKGALSDGRYKEDLQAMDGVLEKINEINGTYFSWNEEKYPDMVFGEGRQIGVIAQDIEKIYPELVNETSRGYKTVDYEKLSVILLEGIKEQQSEIELIQDELETLKEQLNRILEMK